MRSETWTLQHRGAVAWVPRAEEAEASKVGWEEASVVVCQEQFFSSNNKPGQNKIARRDTAVGDGQMIYKEKENWTRHPAMELTDHDKTFVALHSLVTADLCALGAYDPASDNEDEEYDELYCHPVQKTALYVLRKSASTCTLVLSAQDFDRRDIEINSEEEWEKYRSLLTMEGGLPLDTVPPEEAKALAEEARARAEAAGESV